MNLMHKGWAGNNRIIALIAFVLVSVILQILAVNQPLSDYANYYFGSYYWAHDSFNNDVYEAWKLNERIHNAGYENVFINYATLPPSNAIFFSPFSYFTIETSRIIFNLVSFGIFIFSFFRLCKQLNLQTGYLVFLPAVFLLPLRNNFYFGQAYLILFSLFAEGFLAWQAKRYALSGLLLAITALMKIFPLVFILFFAFKKNFKALFWFLGFTFALGFASYFLIEKQIWIVYFREIFPRIPKGEIHDSFSWMFQTFYIFLKEMFVFDQLLNPDAPFNIPMLLEPVHAVFVGLLFFFIASINISSKISDAVKFSSWILFSLLFSAYGSTYSLFILLLPLLVFLSEEREIKKQLLAIGILFLACNIPVHYLGSWPVLLKYPRLYLLFFFAGMFILNYRKYFQWKLLPVVLGFSLVFGIASVYNSPANENDVYYLQKEEALLIHDYKSENGKLKLFFITKDGTESKSLDISDSIYFSSALVIKNNQLFLSGKQLTFSNSRKMKAMMLNGDEIIYLSDKSRGVGFYTLRRLKIK